MKEFAIYTGLRAALFVITFAILWVALHTWLTVWPLLLVALIVTSILSLFVLRTARDRLATTLEARATRMTNRIESSRRTEDQD